MKRIKEIFWKHANCIPWICAGITVLTCETVMKWQYFLTWLSLVWLIWLKDPLDKDPFSDR